MSDLEDRLRRALHAEAERVHPAGDGLSRIQARVAHRRARLRWLRPAAALTTVTALVVGGASYAVFTGNDTQQLVTGPTGSTVPAASSSAGSSANRTMSATPTASTSPGTLPHLPGGAAPLWPYTAGRQVAGASPAAWQAAPDAVAQRFTTGYLGFTDVDMVLSVQSPGPGDALVTVGYKGEGTTAVAAATLHLVRWQGTPSTIWEVVGSKDTPDLSLTVPPQPARSPLKVTGRVTGTEEKVTVQVRQPSSQRPLGSATAYGGGLKPGGMPWSTTVSYTGATDPVLTVVAAKSSGARDAHERFAVAAARRASSSAAGYPDVFAGVDPGGGISTYASADGSLVRRLVAPSGQPDADPQVVGDTVYFLDGAGCNNAVMSVPAAGGPVTRVHGEDGFEITGYALTTDGIHRAYVLKRCVGSGWKVEVLDHGNTTHTFGASSAPPLPTNNPAWSPDGRRLALAVRTGMMASVHVVDPFTATSYADGTAFCGDRPLDGLPEFVAWSRAGLMVGLQSSDGATVGSCTASSATRLFSLPDTAGPASLSVSGAAVLVVAPRTSGGGSVAARWSGGQVHQLPAKVSAAGW